MTDSSFPERIDTSMETHLVIPTVISEESGSPKMVLQEEGLQVHRSRESAEAAAERLTKEKGRFHVHIVCPISSAFHNPLDERDYVQTAFQHNLFTTKKEDAA